MDNPRTEKVAIVEEITSKLTASSAVFVTEYRGMTVGALATLRGSLRQTGAEHKVYKNTLARFAAEQAGVEGLKELLVGPTALTFVTGDSVAAAKALRDAARTNPLLVLKGGALGTSALGGRRHRPRRAALARGAPGPVRPCPAGPAREDGGPPAGAPAQLRLRALGPHRQASRLSGGTTTRTKTNTPIDHERPASACVAGERIERN